MIKAIYFSLVAELSSLNSDWNGNEFLEFELKIPTYHWIVVPMKTQVIPNVNDSLKDESLNNNLFNL